jgi:hypothetical protein
MFNKSFLKIGSVAYIGRIGRFTLEDIYKIRHDRLRRLLSGGADGDRTHDLMNAIHALSQLSYSPARINWKKI